MSEDEIRINSADDASDIEHDASTEDQPSDKSTPLDCTDLSSTEFVQRLQELAGTPHIQLVNCQTTVNGFGAGIALDQSIVSAHGTVKDFAFLLSEQTSWDIHGGAGHACAHSLQSGRVLIRETAGDFCGTFAEGGFIVVYGRAGHYVGYGLSGADTLIRRTVGDFAGAHMKKGVLVLCNGAGEQLGQGMTGGDIFVRGDIQSLAPEVRLQRMKDTDSMRLSLLLARSGMRGGGTKEFKLYRARK